jgi:hypothetical protein
MPSDYRALYAPDSCLTQDQSKLSHQHALDALQWHEGTELRVE